MVVIVMKKPPKDEWSKDYDEFNVTCKSTDNVGDVTDQVRDIYNTRLRLRWVHEASKGLQEALHKASPGSGSMFDEPVARAAEALKYGYSGTVSEYVEIIDTLKGAVTIAFPHHVSGLPAQYLTKMTTALESDESLDEPTRIQLHRILSIVDDGARTQDQLPLSPPCVLWWSGKCLSRDGNFQSYIGKNEKTKIVCKITPSGAPPPVREPPVDHNTQKEMMAFYYRKQEEHKKLIDDDDVTFGNSEWADPHALKKQFNGSGDVKYKW
eukprot:PhF_6_TR12564/c1_g1_i1/m.19691